MLRISLPRRPFDSNCSLSSRPPWVQSVSDTSALGAKHSGMRYPEGIAVIQVASPCPPLGYHMLSQNATLLAAGHMGAVSQKALHL